MIDTSHPNESLRPGPDRPAVQPGQVDHVWGNLRAFLPPGPVGAACQLGGHSLGPHLAALAELAVTAGADPPADPGWPAVAGEAGSAPFADACFDLVVVEDLARAGAPAAAVLGEARRLCRPDGRILVGTRGGPGQRTLRGLPGATLAALPSQRRPAFLMALGEAEPASHFVRSLAFAYRRPGTTGMGARLEGARNRAARLAPPALTLRAAPGRVTVLAGRADGSGPAAPPSLLAAVCEHVQASWSDLALPGRAPARLAALVVGHRRPPTGMLTILLFVPGGSAPVAVAKLPRYGMTAHALEREAAALDRMWGALDGSGVRAALPRPLGLHRVGGTQVLLQTGVAGRSLVAGTAANRLRPRVVGAQFDLVLSWCVAMQRATSVEVSVDERLIAERLEPLAAQALIMLRGDPVVAAVLDRALEDARDLIGTRLPLVASHGDYWAGNIMVRRGTVCGVVDWERAVLDDFPFWDTVKAVASAAYHLDRYRCVPTRGPAALPCWGRLGGWAGIADPHFAKGFRAAFVDPGWLAETARAALVRACLGAGVPPGWLRVAVPFHLARQVAQAADSPRSVAGWGSVLRALAGGPATWAYDLESDPTGTPGAYRSVS